MLHEQLKKNLLWFIIIDVELMKGVIIVTIWFPEAYTTTALQILNNNT